MKILVVSTPLAGHLSPLLPVISALVAAGDEVLVAGGAATAPLVVPTGAQFRPVGNDRDVWFARLAERTRGTPGDGITPDRVRQYFVPRVFGEIGTADMIDDVLLAGTEFAPDLVLFESLAFAGPLVADVLGVPGVNHLFGPLWPEEIFVLANDAVAPIWRSFGRDAPEHAGIYRDLTVEICPPSLESRKVPSGDVVALRPAPRPDGVATRGERPVVYVTLGTLFNGRTEVFREILDGLKDQPVDVVVTVGGDQDPADLEPVPGNARVERFIPQAELLPSCSVIVHHGGAGTTFGALAHGVPQLIVPQGADNFENAEMCERAGLAVMLRRGEFTARAVTDGVNAILGDPRFLQAALRTADEIATMADPAEVAATVRAYRR
jgi:UDP:flavonoid glycosyltransferase YjiC (YdhE family)